MRTSGPAHLAPVVLAIGLAAPLSAAVTLAAPPIGQAGAYTYVVRTAAHTPGKLGTFWLTDLELRNRGPAAATVNLYFLEKLKDNSGAVGRTFPVATNRSLRLVDVLGAQFGVTGSSGAILVGSDQPLLVTSRTYNSASSGTYGQYVEGTPASRGVVQDEVVRLVQLTQNATYRTNVGFASTSASATQGVVELYLANGTKLGERPFFLQPWGAFQEDGIFTKVTGQAVDDGYALVRVTTAGARIFPYASVVDGRTGDPVCAVPVGRPDPAWPGLGGQWSPTGLGAGATAPQPGAQVPALAVTGSRLLASGGMGGGVFVSTDGGATWSRRNVGGFAVTGLAVDPFSPSTLYAVASSSWGVYKSTDAGETWQAVSQALGTNQDKRAVAVDPKDPKVVLAGGFKGLVRSGDAGATWAELSLKAGTQPWVYSIAVDPTSSLTIYVGTELGVYRSTNGGSSFAPATTGIGAVHVNALLIDPASPARVWAGTQSGVFVSTNGGTSWSPVTTGAGAAAVRALARDLGAGVLWAGTSSGPLCSTDNGAHWELCGAGAAGLDVQSLAVVPGRLTTALAGTVTAGAHAMATSELLLPAAAHNPGANNTLWRTDLEVANPGPTAASFEIALLKAKSDNSNPLTKPYTLGPGIAERFEDVLFTELGYTGSAALRVRPTMGRVVATSRTYNAQVQGTYGQFIAGLEAIQAQAPGNTVRLIQLAQSASTTSGFRTNIGLLNASAVPMTVEIRLFDRDATLLGSLSQPLLPFEFRQLDKPFAAFTAADVPEGYANLWTNTAGGSFLAYASVIDNRSGDPVYIPAR
ncbi:MAG: WD40/YVTN/BNR-like repeat-containing protein [Thermoanaerobaculaceae bacterium]